MLHKLGFCWCGTAHAHQLDAVYATPTASEYYARCVCGWRSDWERHCYAAERSLIAQNCQNCQAYSCGCR